jgi:hypothetical protein
MCPKSVFETFGKNSFFFDFLTQKGRKRLSPTGAKWAKKAHLGPKWVKNGQNWVKMA